MLHRILRHCFQWTLFLGVVTHAAPLTLHPENPHYFLYKGKPTLVITSGEHYGAVLNLDFNYVTYLDELASKKLNGTRTFSGAYVEPQGAFNIAQNTLAPAQNRFICPWPRSDTPGYANGGNKFDLSKWDDAYFQRLRDFVEQAHRRGIVVEMNLFCPFYEEAQWNLSPQNVANNINQIGNVARTNVYTLDKNGGLIGVHDAMVKKFVTELNSFDNVYYEICNEPYFGGVTLEWQHHIAETILATERNLPKKHLISRNVANGAAKVENAHPLISVLNFHYAAPPNTVAMNYGLNRVIGDNETGFRGTNNLAYRSEAWAFILAGGGLYNNLDYSFVAGHEDGTFVYPAGQPGGGNRHFRAELQTLRDFMAGFDFIHMKPAQDLVHASVRPGEESHALAKAGKEYAIYIGPIPTKKGDKAESVSTPLKWRELCPHTLKPFCRGTHSVAVEISAPDGNYTAEWIDPVSGHVGPKEKMKCENGTLRIASPEYAEDIGLAVRRR